jgi:CheY-like chemotaxis protein
MAAAHPPGRVYVKPMILIVDGDRVSARAVQQALAATSYQVEWSRDGEAALDTMRRTKVDVVISDSVLSDVSGLTLLHRTTELSGPAAPAFVFVSVDRTVQTKVNLIRGGAADYLLKPVVPDELRARLDKIVEARRENKDAVTKGSASLIGDAEQIPVADVLTMLEFASKSGILEIAAGTAIGRLYVNRGRVVHAQLGNQVGKDAFFALLHRTEGIYRYEAGDVDVVSTLNARVSELLMAAAVEEDTAKHTMTVATKSSMQSVADDRHGVSVVSTSSRAGSDDFFVVPPSGLRAAAARLQVAILDSYLLGDLRLGRSTATDLPTFELELWAPIAVGISLLLPMATAPGFQFLLAAVNATAGPMILQFETPTAMMVIKIIDIDATSAIPSTNPHAIIVMPSHGDLLNMPPQRIAQCNDRLQQTNAIGVIAVGGAALHAMLQRSANAAPKRVKVSLVSAAEEHDLRQLLSDAVAVWKETSAL